MKKYYIITIFLMSFALNLVGQTSSKYEVDFGTLDINGQEADYSTDMCEYKNLEFTFDTNLYSSITFTLLMEGGHVEFRIVSLENMDTKELFTPYKASVDEGYRAIYEYKISPGRYKMTAWAEGGSRKDCGIKALFSCKMQPITAKSEVQLGNITQKGSAYYSKYQLLNNTRYEVFFDISASSLVTFTSGIDGGPVAFGMVGLENVSTGAIYTPSNIKDYIDYCDYKYQLSAGRYKVTILVTVDNLKNPYNEFYFNCVAEQKETIQFGNLTEKLYGIYSTSVCGNAQFDFFFDITSYSSVSFQYGLESGSVPIEMIGLKNTRTGKTHSPNEVNKEGNSYNYKYQLDAGFYQVSVLGKAGNDCNNKVTFSCHAKGNETPTPSTPSEFNNYIVTRTYTKEDAKYWLESYQYYDGLGLPTQGVQVAITPDKKDLVTLQEYDGLGRENESWLPVVYSSNGAYTDPTTIKATAKGINMYNDSAPFSKPVYDNSPLNRVLEQYGPGEAWQANKKSAKSAYLTNIVGVDSLNCSYYTTTLVRDSVIQVSYVRPYDTGELYVTRIEDEDSRASFEFKDKLGQVILTRQVQRNGNTKTFLDTYYIYDDYGNLTAVLPPMASDGMKSGNYSSNTSTVIREYAYLYQYDDYNRCIAKKLPSCEWIFYVYDHADRLIFSQDGNQRKNKEWSFSIPDVLGRESITGICKNTMNPFSPPLNEIVVKAERSDAGTYKGYNLTGLTLVSPTIYAVNYYDDYSFMGKNGIPSETDTNAKYETAYESDGFGKRYVTSAKGLLTGTLLAQLDGSTTAPSYLYSVMYYDYRKRLIQTKSNNHLGGVEKDYIGYNFTGQPVKQKHIHTFGSNTQINLYTYTYDHAGRLLTTRHQLNDGASVILTNNQYDELGRLKTDKRNGQESLKTEYAYNIRSWTKNIKGKLFEQTLYYNDKRSNGTNKPSYTGNISAMDWMVEKDKQRGYDFEYNEQSMLTKGHYLEGNVRNTKFNTSYSYDMHGNMLTLNRYGNTGTTQYGLIDDLKLSYRGNQLIKVDDTGAVPTINTSMDFKDTKEQEVEYAYDRNGNLVKDSNKGITDIQYNSLNLPRKVSFKTGHSTEYVYSASGQKLSVIQKSATQKKTDYVGNLIYENGTLKRILVDGGYIENGNYYFYLTDHLGNNRVVADATGNVIQTNHYYPFGASFAEGVQNTKQPYKYNGKELDQEDGLNLYDYEARQMDPAIGRFISADPAAEYNYRISPYVYCYNNPLIYIDPTGLIVEDIDSIYYNHKQILNSNLSAINIILKGNLSAEMKSLITQIKDKYSSILNEYKELEESDQVYRVFSGGKANAGNVTYNYERGSVDIEIGVGANVGLVGHELTHAYQYEKNKISYPGLGTGGYTGTSTYDLSDEQEAYNRQQFLNAGNTSSGYNYIGQIYFKGYTKEDVLNMGAILDPPAYQNLPDGPLNVSRMMRQEVENAGKNRRRPPHIYKGALNDYMRGVKRSN